MAKSSNHVRGPRISVILSEQIHAAAKEAAAEAGSDLMAWVRGLIERALAKRLASERKS